ncbi:MAG TPA: CNNM domain-containing protein [Candidatus Cloacimonadota bacterium]|nr:CNNM domain-containing protein [Candidatus Cloacimonadota bacterium]
MEDSFSYLAIIGFLLLSAFFSGSETAFFSLSKIQLKKIEKFKSKKSHRIRRLIDKPHELLIIILLGNTIVNVAASSTAAWIAINLANKDVIGLSQSAVLAIEIAIMTILLLIFGEITPKLIAFASPEKYAGFASLFLEILKYILWPIIKILGFLSIVFSNRNKTEVSQHITPEEFKNLIKSKATQDSLEEKEKKILSSILRFSSTIAREIMIPRVDITAVDAAEGLLAVQQLIIDSGHSKIPVYKKNIEISSA